MKLTPGLKEKVLQVLQDRRLSHAKPAMTKEEVHQALKWMIPPYEVLGALEELCDDDRIVRERTGWPISTVFYFVRQE